ncbi:MAG: class I tRNA ligase family protein [Mycoplasmoidaceae bacterium]|nr:class I tRNA ligase family protein [Mycoplasmoidaceae bacterium]
MSKSLDNIINPHDYINEFGSDAFRYYIVRQVNLEKDGIFSKDLFVETFNTQLANNYGNMATRVAGMLKKYFNNVVPAFDKTSLTNLDNDVLHHEEALIKSYKDDIEKFDINKLLDKIQDQYGVLNKYIEDAKP